jgi:choice-of-anchor A domain-containing protein
MLVRQGRTGTFYDICRYFFASQDRRQHVMMNSIVRSAAGAMAAAGIIFTAAPAFAVPLTAEEILQQFNLVVFGDLASTSEVEGRTYIGGDLNSATSNYFTKGNEAPASDLAALIVGGDVNGGPFEVNHGGSAVVGGDLNGQINLNGSGGIRYVAGAINVPQNGDPGSTVQGPVEIPDFETPLRQLSGDLAGLAANSTTSFDGDKGIFTGTPDAGGLAVFWIDGVDFFGTAANLEFLVDGAGTVIVNVAGDVIDIAANFLNGIGETIASSLVWNFYEATDITIETAFYGTILAPNALVTNANLIVGSVATNEFIQNGEIQLASPSTEVPEPATALLLLPALFGLLVMSRRFRRQGAAA